jgi:hypothetical protein
MRCVPVLVALIVGLSCLTVRAVARSAQQSDPAAEDGLRARQQPGGKTGEKLVPLNKSGTVLLDAKGKRVLLKSKVVLREGLLEMLLCLAQTKEHESILAVDAKAQIIHAGLLALGAKPGRPVEFEPFKSPTGQKIDIFVEWTDRKGKRHRKPAQTWMRHVTRRFYGEPLDRLPKGLKIPEESELRYDQRHRELSWFGPMTAKGRDELLKLSNDPQYCKAIRAFHNRSQPRQMQADWVFAGSGFWVDEKTGEKHYQAEGGDVICVANFPTAMIDVAIKSSATGQENLLFEPYTERIPPLGTDVTVELVPVLKKKGARTK